MAVHLFGNKDTELSDRLKIWLVQGDVGVCGAIGEGTSKELTSEWNRPFEAESIGSDPERQNVAGLTQFGTSWAARAFGSGYGGFTSKTTLHTLQVWEGNAPHAFNVVLELYALADARLEVMGAIQALERMAAPNLNSVLPVGGRIPGPVSLTIGRVAMWPWCVIKSISIPLDGPKTADGYLTSATVTMQIETATMLDQPDVDKMYNF